MCVSVCIHLSRFVHALTFTLTVSSQKFIQVGLLSRSQLKIKDKIIRRTCLSHYFFYMAYLCLLEAKTSVSALYSIQHISYEIM